MSSQEVAVLERQPSAEDKPKMIRDERRRIRDERRQARLEQERQQELSASLDYVTVQSPIGNDNVSASSPVISSPRPSGSSLQITEFVDGIIKHRWRSAWHLMTSSDKRMGSESKKNRSLVVQINYQTNTDQFKELFRLYDIDATVEDVIQAVEKIRDMEAVARAKNEVSENYGVESYVANLAISMLSATLFTAHKICVFHTKVFNESRYDINCYKKYWAVSRRE